MKKNTFSILVVLASTILGLFFIYKGINKHFLSPCKVYEASSTIPIEYQNLTTSFCQSGYFMVIGFFQILAGLLLIIPKTRLLGSIILLPIILNIFLIHLIMDNRPEELIETGIPLLLTLFVFGHYYPIWKKIL